MSASLALVLPEHPTANDALRWYVAYTEPRAEFDVVDALGRLGVEGYAPWETLWRTNARKSWVRKVIKLPLIPRYVFVELDEASPRTDLVEGVKGVDGILRAASGKPVPVLGHQLNRIRWHQLRGLYDCTLSNNGAQKRKAKKALRDVVQRVEYSASKPTTKDHPFGQTYRVVSKQS